MKVTKLESAAGIRFEGNRPTEAQLMKEHDYLVAKSMTDLLLENGLIDHDEYNKIMDENRKTFSPLIAQIT